VPHSASPLSPIQMKERLRRGEMHKLMRVIGAAATVLAVSILGVLNLGTSAIADEYVNAKTVEINYGIGTLSVSNPSLADIYNLVEARANNNIVVQYQIGDAINQSTNKRAAENQEFYRVKMNQVGDAINQSTNARAAEIRQLITDVGDAINATTWQAADGVNQNANTHAASSAAQYQQLMTAIAEIDGGTGGDNAAVADSLASIQLLWGSVTGENCLGKETVGGKLKCLITREFQTGENDRMIEKMQDLGSQIQSKIDEIREAFEQGQAEVIEGLASELEELQQQREAIEAAAAQAHQDAIEQMEAAQDAADQAHADSAAEQSKLDGIRGAIEAQGADPGDSGINGISGLAGGYSDQIQTKLDTWTAPMSCVVSSITTGECGGGPTIQLGDFYTWQPLASGCDLLPSTEISVVRQLLGAGVILSALFVCVSMILSLFGVQLAAARGSAT
jgi:hypothetical protein